MTCAVLVTSLWTLEHGGAFGGSPTCFLCLRYFLGLFHGSDHRVA